MKDSILNNTLNYICKNKGYTEEKKEELKYGLEALYLNSTKLVVLFLLTLIGGIFKEAIIFFGFYALLRTFAFGLHAKNSLGCWLISIPTFIAIPYISTIITLNIYIKIIILLVCMVNFLLYAPADTEKRPLVNKKRRIFFKILTILICFIYLIALFYIKNNTLSNLIVFATFIEAFATNILSYKLFNESFNNYKFYKV